MKIIWSPKYEIGVPVIDNQHRRIVEYINQIYDLKPSETATDDLKELFYNLIDYTYSHFAFEENLMKEAKYDEIEAHKITHDTFCKQIDVLHQRFDQGEQVASELAEMLQEWLLNHIMTDDMSYSEIVKKWEKSLGGD